MLESLRVFQEYTDLANRTGSVNLAQGLPEPILSADLEHQLERCRDHHWQYVQPEGIPELRAGVARLYSGCFDADEVLITSGCTESLFIALASAREACGDELAFLEPFYPYYLGMASALGMRVTALPMVLAAGRIAPDWDAVEHHLGRTTGTLLLNSPHNPTGWTLRSDEARDLGEMCSRHGWAVVCDHVYFGFDYESQEALASAAWLRALPEVWVAGSASKLLSSTGLRVGWLLTRSARFGEALGRHMCLSYCQPQLLQKGVAGMLDAFDYRLPEAIVKHYRSKRDLLSSALGRMGLAVNAPEGGHFVLADYSPLEPEMSPADFARHLQTGTGVVCLPAEPFYLSVGKRHVRFSFGAPMDRIRAACDCVAAYRSGALRC